MKNLVAFVLEEEQMRDRVPRRGAPGSPEFIEHQHQLGAPYRELLAKNVESENGRISPAIENRTLEQAMKLLPFEVIDESGLPPESGAIAPE
jgi:hypothetical protein